MLRGEAAQGGFSAAPWRAALAWSWAPRLAAADAHANCASSGYATGWDATGAQPCIQADSTRRQGFYPANRLEESNQVLRIEYFSSRLRGAQRARKLFRDSTHHLLVASGRGGSLRKKPEKLQETWKVRARRGSAQKALIYNRALRQLVGKF